MDESDRRTQWQRVAAMFFRVEIGGKLKKIASDCYGDAKTGRVHVDATPSQARARNVRDGGRTSCGAIFEL